MCVCAREGDNHIGATHLGVIWRVGGGGGVLRLSCLTGTVTFFVHDVSRLGTMYICGVGEMQHASKPSSGLALISTYGL